MSQPGIVSYSEAAEELLPGRDPIRRIALALQQGGPDKFIIVAGIVLESLATKGAFYHPKDSPSFDEALFFAHETKELERVHSDKFAQWVSDAFAINRASRQWNFVWKAIENAAIGKGSTPIEPEAYWASRPDAVYISSGPGSIVKVTAARTELLDNGADGILFPRGATLAPWKLTNPEDPFERCDLFKGLNATAGHGAMLVKLWALSLPTTPKNKPPLVLAGTIGSGKTRCALGLCELYGLRLDGRTLKVEDAGERDLGPILEAGGIAILDNADTRVKWLADTLASASTGAGQTKRKLYKDTALVTMRPRAWVAITTARPDSFAGDPGLADRLLIVRMERREGDTKDAELSAQIANCRDAGLSWVCAMLSKALGDTATPPGGLNQRHPDFARMAFRLGRALGKEAEAVAALQAAEADKALFCLENDTVGAAVLALVNSGASFTGGARELLERLKAEGYLDADSPLTPKGLGKRLDGLWAHLGKAISARKSKNRDHVAEYTLGSLKPATASNTPNVRQRPDLDAV